MNRLIERIIKKITVDYRRLSIVENRDGFLMRDVVRNYINQYTKYEVIGGTNLQLRIHFELEYKTNPDAHYIYVGLSNDTLLEDMREEANVVEFSISDMFPLFRNKSLLKNLDFDVIERLYAQVASRQVGMSEAAGVIDAVRRQVEDERARSGECVLGRLKQVEVDWNKPKDTISALSRIIVEAVRNGCYERIDGTIQEINRSFQAWIDEHYFALQNSNAQLKAQCVNKILPHIAANSQQEEPVALIVVDGLSYWQYAILHDYLMSKGIVTDDMPTFSWLPSITMLSRQAIFRGGNPVMDYKQCPENERKLWVQYWRDRGLLTQEIQYLSDKDEFAINEGVKRLAYVTVEMDEKMHSSTDYRDLCSLTENWCPRIVEKIETMRKLGYVIYLTTDHGSVWSKGWRRLSQVEKVFLYKDGSRGRRHLIYNNEGEQRSFYSRSQGQVAMMCHDDWLAVRDDACFETEGNTLITHGGSHFMEMVIPFVKIERK